MPLSRGEDWDTIIKRRRLRYNHQEEKIEIQLSRGEDWDTIIYGGIKNRVNVISIFSSW
jgi:hypothetical protein